MGLDVYLYEGEQSIELPSTKHPEHLFKIGYFRSSYNGNGWNAQMRNAGLETLEDIFKPGDEYEVKPDWALALARAERALEIMDMFIAGPAGQYRVIAVSHNMFFEPTVTDEFQALEIFVREWNRDNSRDQSRDDVFGRAYGNRDGEFYFGGGLHVAGFIPGKRHGKPAVFAVIHSTDHWPWYRQALEVVIETCQWVLASGKPEAYCLHWSG